MPRIASFRVLNFGYAKDAFNIFFQGVEVRGASNSSFKVLIDGYAKDSFSAYYCGEEIPNCNVRRFECMGNGVARDNVNKYYLGKKWSGNGAALPPIGIHNEGHGRCKGALLCCVYVSKN